VINYDRRTFGERRDNFAGLILKRGRPGEKDWIGEGGGGSHRKRRVTCISLFLGDRKG